MFIKGQTDNDQEEKKLHKDETKRGDGAGESFTAQIYYQGKTTNCTI